MSQEETKSSGVHFCILIHGLWGNPSHLGNLASSLQDAHSREVLHILIAKRNPGSFTYDGIETGAERVTQEIEDELAELEKTDKKVSKISIVGYSLGGLIARYAIGLLYSKGWFKKMEPMNFTTFATPHLGVRSPVNGWPNQVWNTLGGSTLSFSGRQLFLIDKFRDTQRPILSVLADPESVFMKALSSFKQRSLYANAINDRAVPFYTGFISRTDPFIDINKIDMNYVPGYEDVIMDSDIPALPKKEALSFFESFSTNSSMFFSKAPYYLAISVLAPIGSIAWLINSGVQTMQSSQRIKLHEEGKAGVGISAYKLPLMIEDMQKRTEAAVEQLNTAQGEDLLLSENRDDEEISRQASTNAETASKVYLSSPEYKTDGFAKSKHNLNDAPLQKDFPHLALAPEQFAMADSLDNLQFRKYAVYIHKANHSHAAIVVRSNRSGFQEGHVVFRHFIERFEI